MEISRDDLIAFRWHRHQLDRPARSVPATDVDLLDLGLQDTGGGGAAWALENRGARPPRGDALFWAWTLRGAPHAYRRTDAKAIATATAPYSEADAAKRIFDASSPLNKAEIPVLDALDVIAGHLREIVKKDIVKGDVSSALTDTLDAPYVRWCNPCQATHSYEQPFRIASLQAGIELEPGTSPPVMKRIAGLRAPRYAHLAGDADPQFDVLRNYLRFYGPARHRDAASFADMPIKEASANWPEDVEEVTLRTGGKDGIDTDGKGGAWFVLADDVAAIEGAGAAMERNGVVRLLGPFDPYLQLRDRQALVADDAHRKDLWRTLGRPGAVALDGGIVGTWRPKTSGKKLTITFDHWTRWSKATSAAVDSEAERLAEFRGLELA